MWREAHLVIVGPVLDSLTLVLDRNIELILAKFFTDLNFA